MDGNTHLVARQTIELIASDAVDTSALVERTSSAGPLLAAAIERSLDTVDRPDQRLRIDRIVLDLGACDPAHWEGALAEGIRQRLAARIIEEINRGSHVRDDAATAALHMLDEFARSGWLPWWCSSQDTPESAIETLELRNHRPDAIRAILIRPAAVDRLVNQLDGHHLWRLLRLARPDLDQSSVAAGLGLAAASLPSEPPGKSMPRTAGGTENVALWRSVLSEAATAVPMRPGMGGSEVVGAKGDEASTREFVAAVIRRHQGAGAATSIDHAEDHPEIPGKALVAADSRPPAPETSPAGPPAADLSTRIMSLSVGRPAAIELLSRLAILTGRLDQPSVAAVHKILDSGTGLTVVPAILDRLCSAGLISSSDAQLWRDSIASIVLQSEEVVHDALAVRGCGLLLIWHFLPAFFANLGMLDGERFRDAAAQHRAATLLHVIATGEYEWPEQELMLAKVLAGLDVDELHEPGEPLDPLEIEGIGELLDDVLGHAPMLGRISIAGLREAFLSRPGLLSTRDGHWLLRVERRSIDILLDRLPWSFAWARLPWMTAPVQIEW